MTKMNWLRIIFICRKKIINLNPIVFNWPLYTRCQDSGQMGYSFGRYILSFVEIGFKLIETA